MLQFFALAVSASQANSANSCLGGSFTLTGTFPTDGSLATDFGVAMKQAVKSMTGVTTLPLTSITVAISTGGTAERGDCDAAIAASPAPTLAPVSSGNSTSTSSGTGTGTGTGTSPSDGPSTGGTGTGTGGTSTDSSGGPSAGPAVRLLFDESIDMDLFDEIIDMEDARSGLTRQLASHAATATEAHVGYTVIADEDDIVAISTEMESHDADEMLDFVRNAVGAAVAADSSLTAPTVTGSTVHDVAEPQADTRTAAPLPGTGSGTGEDNFASKSALAWFGLTLSATAILV